MELFILLVAPEGIEPSLTGPKPVVLPLYHRASWVREVGLEPTKSSDSGFFRKLKELQSALVATGALPNFQVEPPAPQIRLIIRLLQDLHPEIHPKIKSDSLIIILYIKHYLQVLNNLTIMMPCGILLYFLLFCLFLSNKYVTLKYHFGLDWNWQRVGMVCKHAVGR